MAESEKMIVMCTKVMKRGKWKSWEKSGILQGSEEKLTDRKKSHINTIVISLGIKHAYV